MRMHGVKGIRENSINAVLNARYLRSLLEPLIPAAKSAENMHEFILTLKDESRFDGLTAMTIAKNLLDHGFHAPTVYFDSQGMAMMATETESRRTLMLSPMLWRRFSKSIRRTVRQPNMPHTLPVKRLDALALPVIPI